MKTEQEIKERINAINGAEEEALREAAAGKAQAGILPRLDAARRALQWVLED